MISLSTAMAFFGAAVLLALTPGPDNIFVMSLAASRGLRAAGLLIFGLCSGLIVHTVVAATGLSVVITSRPELMTLICWCGAVYLLYLAYGMWTAKPTVQRVDLQEKATENWLFRGVVMNLTNPKVLLFFLAFFPQFIPQDSANGLQFFQLGLLFILAALLVFFSLALITAKCGAMIRKGEGGGVIMNRITALIFVALSLHLMFS